MVVSVKILQMWNCASTCSKHTCGCDIQIVESFNVTAFWHCKFETVIEEMGGINGSPDNRLDRLLIFSTKPTVYIFHGSSTLYR
ncbi:hypothetical protein T11_11583, partial [Trichinella zimbabwensis]